MIWLNTVRFYTLTTTSLSQDLLKRPLGIYGDAFEMKIAQHSSNIPIIHEGRTNVVRKIETTVALKTISKSNKIQMPSGVNVIYWRLSKGRKCILNSDEFAKA